MGAGIGPMARCCACSGSLFLGRAAGASLDQGDAAVAAAAGGRRRRTLAWLHVGAPPLLRTGARPRPSIGCSTRPRTARVAALAVSSTTIVRRCGERCRLARAEQMPRPADFGRIGQIARQGARPTDDHRRCAGWLRWFWRRRGSMDTGTGCSTGKIHVDRPPARKN